MVNCKTPLEVAMEENQRLRNKIDELEQKYETICRLFLKTDELYKDTAIELHRIEDMTRARFIDG